MRRLWCQVVHNFAWHRWGKWRDIQRCYCYLFKGPTMPCGHPVASFCTCPDIERVNWEDGDPIPHLSCLRCRGWFCLTCALEEARDGLP